MIDDPVLGRRTPRFGLQWHITHACDLSCAHCYDRTELRATPWDDCRRVLDELEAFCRARDVTGSVALSGGNPFLHPRFFDVYEAVVDRGFAVSLLANPVTAEVVERLVAIRRPAFYQVSLEGLEEHNDCIRGPGSFRRVLELLPILDTHGIRSVIMLTLTRKNLGEVIPLARLLRGRVGRFTYNRLVQVGRGAALAVPSKEEYAEFAIHWVAEQQKDPKGLGLKDNLLNVVQRAIGQPLSGGCSGFGCGAAFNFVAVLPDGDAHACRKFPSPIGNVLTDGLAAVYDGEAARRYRRGCSACDECAIRRRCGGCLAVASAAGLDPYRERDPMCFIDDLPPHRLARSASPTPG
jgi:selenobiotic family peptide radical SAM maturase